MIWESAFRGTGDIPETWRIPETELLPQFRSLLFHKNPPARIRQPRYRDSRPVSSYTEGAP